MSSLQILDYRVGRRIGGIKQAKFDLTYSFWFEETGHFYGKEERWFQSVREYLELAYENRVGVCLSLPAIDLTKASSWMLPTFVSSSNLSGKRCR